MNASYKSQLHGLWICRDVIPHSDWAKLARSPGQRSNVFQVKERELFIPSLLICVVRDHFRRALFLNFAPKILDIITLNLMSRNTETKLIVFTDGYKHWVSGNACMHLMILYIPYLLRILIDQIMYTYLLPYVNLHNLATLNIVYDTILNTHLSFTIEILNNDIHYPVLNNYVFIILHWDFCIMICLTRNIFLWVYEYKNILYAMTRISYHDSFAEIWTFNRNICATTIWSLVYTCILNNILSIYSCIHCCALSQLRICRLNF